MTAVVAATAFAAAIPAAASADTYSVYACRTPAGTVAARDGWVPFQVAGASSATDTCAANDALTGQMVPSAAGNSASWTVVAPAGLPITGYVLYRWAEVTNATDDGVGYQHVYQLLEDGTAVEALAPPYLMQGDLGSPAAPLSDANVFVRSGLRIGTLAARVTCLSGTCPAQPAGRYGGIFQIYRAALQLEDSTDPTFTATPSGGLWDTSKVLSGVQSTSFGAHDDDSGVYLATIEVDGRPAVSQVLDENDGRCRKPFTYLVPCKKTAAGTVSIDTATLPDGPHSVRLLVSDASETNQIAFGPVTINTRNLVRGALNGTNASDSAKLTAHFAGRKGRSLTSRLGRKARMVGRLTDENGRAIAGATLRILGRDQRLGAREADLGGAKTRANGTWGFTLGRSPARKLRIGYHSHVYDVAYAATAPLTLNVRAAASLRARPRVVRRGARVSFSGRLFGRPIPRGGKLVDLQAYEAGRWRLLDTIRSRASGRYSYRYRFVRAAKTFRFRLRIRRDQSYPYSLGYSPTVRVRVLP